MLKTFTVGQGEPETTVLYNPLTSYEYTVDSFSMCSRRVHRENKIGGAIKTGTQEIKESRNQETIEKLQWLVMEAAKDPRAECPSHS